MVKSQTEQRKYMRQYMKRYCEELTTQIVFISTNGTMRSPLNNKRLNLYGNIKNPDKAELHHVIPLNGNRPKGQSARLKECYDNIWNIMPLQRREHLKHHKEEEHPEISPISEQYYLDFLGING